MANQRIMRELSYQDLNAEHSARLANAYTEIGVIYQEAGMDGLAKIAALQAAWFRNNISETVVVG